MYKKFIVMFLSGILLAFVLGCTGPAGGEVNETKLEVNEGLGIVGTLKIDELNPGLDGYISLTVRNNLGGENAHDVIVALDNVYPFTIFECGKANDPQCLRSNNPTASACINPANCFGEYDLDTSLAFRQHGTSIMFPGQELDMSWRVRAPSADDISDIALKHPIYYDIEYFYRTQFTQNVVFMSRDEVKRRQQVGEDYQVSGEAHTGAGELIVSGSTQQPLVYFYSSGFGQAEYPFSFNLQYSVENKGKGIPLSDVVILFELPEEKDMVVADDVNLKSYGWYHWSYSDKTLSFVDSAQACYTGKTQTDGTPEAKDCSAWVRADVFGADDFDRMFKDQTRVLVKVVKRTDFISSFDLNIPLQIMGGDSSNNVGLYKLKQQNLPVKIFAFNVHAMYRYFVEGKEYITVYPIKI